MLALLFTFSFALLPGLAFASIAGGSLTSDPSAASEFHLVGPPDSASATKWMNDRMPSLREPTDAKISADKPTAEALIALGLPETLPSNMKIQLIPPRPGQTMYWLHVTSERGVIGEFPFELPPVYVWKDVDDF